MNLRFQHDCTNIDWEYVSEVLRTVGMASHSGAIHHKAFGNSHTVLFVFDSDKIVGFGRALSDGAYQAAIYDVVVLPEYQGKGIGRMIVNSIIKELPQCNIILYAAPGKDAFYKTMNFKRMKTGMALFLDADTMQGRGFVE